MKKITVKPTGKFLLRDRHNGTIIDCEKEVDLTPFVAERIGTGELEVVAVEAPKKSKAKPKTDEQ